MPRALAVLAALLVFVFVAGLRSPQTQADPTKADLLFVQSAGGARIEGNTLALTGLSPVVVFFSDRPERLAGHLRMSGFMKAWSEAGDSFAADPPNANLSVLGPGRITNTQVVLKSPSWNGSDLTYQIEILGGDRPAEGEATLFIDGLFEGNLLGSGAKGAALGAIGGAIGGDAGKGAAIGAAVGAAGNLLNKATSDN